MCGGACQSVPERLRGVVGRTAALESLARLVCAVGAGWSLQTTVNLLQCVVAVPDCVHDRYCPSWPAMLPGGQAARLQADTVWLQEVCVNALCQVDLASVTHIRT